MIVADAQNFKMAKSTLIPTIISTEEEASPPKIGHDLFKQLLMTNYLLFTDRLIRDVRYGTERNEIIINQW